MSDDERATRRLQGRIVEEIHYDRVLSKRERRKVTRYVERKWGIRRTWYERLLARIRRWLSR